MTARITIAAATAALALTFLPATAPAAAKKKKPRTPAAWVKAQKDAKLLFAVLRRPGTAADKPAKTAKKPAPIAASRKLGTLTGKSFYLVLRGADACLAVTFSTGQSAGEFCVAVAKIKAGKALPQALESAGGAAFDFVVAVPDGATVMRTKDGTSTPQTVTDNGALIAATPFGGSVDVTLKSGAVLKLPLGLAL